MQNKGARVFTHSSDRMPELEPGSVRLIFESPPFEKMHACCQDPDCLAGYQEAEYVERFTRFLPERLRVLADSGSYVLNFQAQVIDGCDSSADLRLPLAIIEAGFRRVETHHWVKPNASPMVQGKRLKNAHEYLWHFTKTPEYLFNKDAVREPHLWEDRDPRKKQYHPLGKDPGNVFTASKSNDQKQFDHPGKMREGIASRFIQLLSGPGDLVVDGFAGTGQTGLEALALGRAFIGYELHAERTATAQGRLGITEAQENAQMKTWMNATEVASYTGLAVTTIYSKTSREEIPVHRGCGKPRFHKDEIDAWMMGNGDRSKPRKNAQIPVDKG